MTEKSCFSGVLASLRAIIDFLPLILNVNNVPKYSPYDLKANYELVGYYWPPVTSKIRF